MSNAASDKFEGIRIANPSDESALLEILALNYQENPMASVNWSKVLDVIKRATQKKGGIIGVIEGPGGIEATAGFIITSWWFSDDLHLEEMWTFVHGDHRRSTHAKRLYQFGQWLSEKFDKMPVLFGVLTTTRMAAKVRLAQRQMPQVGAIFLHNRTIPEAYNQRFTTEPKGKGV